MKNRHLSILIILFVFIVMTGFKPPKNSYPKNDILYSKYGGDIEKMLEGERRADSIARPFMYQTKTEENQSTSASNIDDESIILEKAELMPQFPDGDKGLKDYIASGIAFIPDTLVGKKATVMIKFYINTLGDAKDPKIIKTNDPSFDLQTIMLIDGMPKWTPGKQNGKEVNCYITLPIQYGQ